MSHIQFTRISIDTGSSCAVVNYTIATPSDTVDAITFVGESGPDRVRVETRIAGQDDILDSLKLDPSEPQNRIEALLGEIGRMQPFVLAVLTDDIEQASVVAQSYVISGRQPW